MQPRIGSHLGRYEILSVLGEGGMGAVYRARDAKLGREVALKIIHPGTAGVTDLSRVRHEAQVLDVATPERSLDPTRTSGAGTIVGTAAYMSPEQARGRPLDRRTDVWAFGCVVFEMLGGRQAFAGETVSDSVAAILGRDPEWASLPSATPAAVRRLLTRCLEREHRRRLRDIGDAKLEIEDALA